MTRNAALWIWCRFQSQAGEIEVRGPADFSSSNCLSASSARASMPTLVASEHCFYLTLPSSGSPCLIPSNDGSADEASISV
jgi:hypothetical protein